MMQGPTSEKGNPLTDTDPPKSSGAPTRVYVVIEQQHFDDDDDYFVEVHRVKARNAPNALRKAFRELKDRDTGREPDAVLLAIPESMWRPTPVRARTREHITVDVGAVVAPTPVAS